MQYNTSTLAYNLLSGNLRSKRKHSEQLNKYLAGLIDTDGCISLFIYKTRCTKKTRVKVCLDLTQTAKNDPDFEVIRALQEYYNLGSLYYKTKDHSAVCSWSLRDKDAKVLFNRVGKHLRLKGTHFDNMVWISEQHKDVDDIPDPVVDELKEFRACSRKNTKYLKMPKHLSWAYVAGVIAGDGHIKIQKRNKYTECVLRISTSNSDRGYLDLFKRDFKGNIYEYETFVSWERNLGIRDSSFVVPFLKKVRMYIIHPHKYQRIEKILSMHEKRRQQRLNEKSPKG